MKLSYVNAIAELCERLDADVADVTEGLGFDKRIGQALLSRPALAVAALLRPAGVEPEAYGPGVLAADAGLDADLLTVVDDLYVAARDADALVVLTEWRSSASWTGGLLTGVVRRPQMLDARTSSTPNILRRAGFEWIGLGARPACLPGRVRRRERPAAVIIKPPAAIGMRQRRRLGPVPGVRPSPRASGVRRQHARSPAPPRGDTTWWASTS
jgi:hypothetical protein